MSLQNGLVGDSKEYSGNYVTREHFNQRRCVRIIILSAITVLAFLSFILIEASFDWVIRPMYHSPVYKMVYRPQSSLPMPQKRFSKDRKRILMYTGLFGRPWYGIPTNVPADFLTKFKCEHANCEITYDKNLLKQSDGLLFHARDMPGADHLRQIRKEVPQHQRWAYFISENPWNTPSPQPLNGLFNITMTFKKDSDIWVPYLKYLNLTDEDPRPDSRKNYAEGKEPGAAWIVSHCGLLRQDYVKILEQKYPVYVGGGCKGLYKKQMDCSSDCVQQVKSKYKFYLAFENGFCREYITEKYWYNAMNFDAIPIVMGGGPYDLGPYGAVPGSYINVEDFATVQDLANYLNYLDKNDTAYNEYFKWKQKYKLWNAIEGGWPYPEIILCGMCSIVHNLDFPTKIYNDLSVFWGTENNCAGRERKVAEIIARSR